MEEVEIFVARDRYGNLNIEDLIRAQKHLDKERGVSRSEEEYRAAAKQDIERDEAKRKDKPWWKECQKQLEEAHDTTVSSSSSDDDDDDDDDDDEEEEVIVMRDRYGNIRSEDLIRVRKEYDERKGVSRSEEEYRALAEQEI